MTVHASAVAVDGRGVLILGPSGSGKSALALRLMAAGAVLIADDRVVLRCDDGTLLADAPAALAGRIEARGIGILNAAHAPAPLHLAVDLGRDEPQRLPVRHHTIVCGVRLPLVLGPFGDHLAWGILQYLKAGRAE
ncbi:HPr kinase/phosphorylase [Falsirhodobacter algicola]|uniref:Serine kinase n=1 Tax=Falsirhodobacter algicola TaxID=2692330 RepID=A0A8J8MUA0_9RHOB|nr:HPr kinase/phosphatase C-terminal domain-containing protein [Falsirhodobacter algicola]QUS36531.1 serine kinase [Falsirhodobacter algicola]